MTSSRRSSMQRLACDRGGDLRGEDVAIHRQRMAAGHARFLRRRASSSESSRRSSSLSSHGADRSCSDFSELLQTSSASRSVWCAGCAAPDASRAARREAAPRDLPGGFRAGQPAADDVNGFPRHARDSRIACDSFRKHQELAHATVILR